jgi:hypothetical protein
MQVDVTNPAVFNATFYAARYPDLAAAGLVTPAQLAAHWVNFGLREGRQGSAEFHSLAYAVKNPDLLQELASNITQQLAAHYIVRGKPSGRNGTP